MLAQCAWRDGDLPQRSAGEGLFLALLGQTFKIYLPRVDDATEPLEPRTAPVKPLHGRETVLLVEDEEAVLALARKILQRNGLQGSGCAGGPRGRRDLRAA